MRIAQEEIFGPVLVVIRSTPKTRRSPSPTTRSTVSPAGSGRRTAPRPCASPRPCAPARCTSTPTTGPRRAALGRLQAERRPGRSWQLRHRRVHRAKSVIFDTSSQPLGLYRLDGETGRARHRRCRARGARRDVPTATEGIDADTLFWTRWGHEWRRWAVEAPLDLDEVSASNGPGAPQQGQRWCAGTSSYLPSQNRPEDLPLHR